MGSEQVGREIVDEKNGSKVMMSNTIPTLVTREIVNPKVCSINQGLTWLCWPDGSGQVINDYYKSDPDRLRALLFDWLSVHITAVMKECKK